MSRGFIIGAGGEGLSVHAAVLHVTAPVGSTVSIAKGGVTVKSLGPERGHAKVRGVNADYYFSIAPANYGEWTVTAALGGESASEVVTISANQQVDVAIWYKLWLYHDGDTCSSVSGGWEATDLAPNAGTCLAPTLTFNAGDMQAQYHYSGVIETVEQIDLSKINTLHVELMKTWAVQDCYFGVRSQKAGGSDAIPYTLARVQCTAEANVRRSFALDVSGLQENASVFFHVWADGTSTWEGHIYRVWGEK